MKILRSSSIILILLFGWLPAVYAQWNFDNKLFLRTGVGYNSILFNLDEEVYAKIYKRTKGFRLAPNINVSYTVPVSRQIELSPFVGYADLSGVTDEDDRRKTTYEFRSLSMGMRIFYKYNELRVGSVFALHRFLDTDQTRYIRKDGKWKIIHHTNIFYPTKFTVQGGLTATYRIYRDFFVTAETTVSLRDIYKERPCCIMGPPPEHIRIINVNIGLAYNL